MVDSSRVTRLLARVTDTTAELGAASNATRSRQWLCAAEGWGPPATNADAMHLLARLEDFDAFAVAVARWLETSPD